MDDST